MFREIPYSEILEFLNQALDSRNVVEVISLYCNHDFTVHNKMFLLTRISLCKSRSIIILLYTGTLLHVLKGHECI